MTGNLLGDLRYAIRMLAASPAITASAVLTLALGIGANTAIFSVANALLFRPLPYKDPDQLVIVTNARGPNRRPFSYSRATFLQDHSRSFASFAPFVSESFNMTGRGDPELLPAARVGWNFFDVLGVRASRGRTFRPEEDQPSGRPVVLISDSLWRRRFGADPRVIGQSILLDSVANSIIGVMPVNFEFAPLGRSTDIWSTRTFEFNGLSPQQVHSGAAYLIAIARVQPSLPLSQAQVEMGVLDAQYRQEHAALADADPRLNISLNKVQELMVAEVRRGVLVLFGAVAFLLLIACANVASLLLSRALSRKKEIAIRTALGAGRARIIGQLLTESAVLALISGALGAALSVWGVRLMSALAQRALPRINPLQVDQTALAFTLVVSLLTAILFGLVPALQLSRSEVQIVLRDEGRGTAGSRRRNLTRSLLVVSQIALSVILLIGAGLLLRSLARLQHVTLGFNPDRILLLNIALPPSRYPAEVHIARFFDRVINQVAGIPGVKSVAVSSALPLHPYRYSPVLPEGQPETPVAQRPALSIQAISPAYFKTLGIPLLEGRTFNDRDKDGAPLVAMVNAVFAQRYWPGESAVGKHVLLGTTTTPLQIVGVTGNVKNIMLSVVATPELYYPLAQRPSQAMNLIVRSTANPYGLLAPVHAQILAIDKEQPVTNVRSMQEHLAESIAPNRLTTLLLGIFSVVALVVATVGLYGSVAYSTAQRAQELGIRLALGAAPGSVLRLVMWQGLGLAILGVLAGLAGSLALTRVMQSLLFQVSAIDAWTYAACAFLFVIVALAASYVPARRAAQLDPCEALRHE